MNTLLKSTFALLLLFALFACSDDEGSPLQSYVEALVEVRADAFGRAATMRTDDGTTYTVESGPNRLTADSLYRTLALYVEKPGGKVAISQMGIVFSPFPSRFRPENVKTDVIGVQALWHSDRYVNLKVAIPAGGKAHRFAFVHEGIAVQADGSRLWSLRLYHDQNGDPAYFTREAYMSCPIFHRTDSMRPGTDSICFRVRTGSGERTLRFAY